jgi:hypothetical protein
MCGRAPWPTQMDGHTLLSPSSDSSPSADPNCITPGPPDPPPGTRLPRFKEAATGISCDVSVNTNSSDFKSCFMELLHRHQPLLALLIQLASEMRFGVVGPLGRNTCLCIRAAGHLRDIMGGTGAECEFPIWGRTTRGSPLHVRPN